LLLFATGFIICSILIVWGGSRLSKYGDAIAELTGVGKAWFGLVLMAAVTSLPELFTGIGSAAIFNTPDIAVGDVMGSCAFNLLILAILDYFMPQKPLLSIVTKSHAVAGFFSIFLVTVVVITILLGSRIPLIGWFSSASVLLVALYFFAIYIIFKNERQQPAAGNTNPAAHPVSLNTAVIRYALFAGVVITGALVLPYFAGHLATRLGLSQSFVGTLLVAVTTSLPELAVAITAVRIGSVNIAVGNLLGSNIFNMLILGLDDFFYLPGSLLGAANPNHALSGLATLLMTAVAGIGIMYSTPVKRFALGLDAIALIILYVILLIILYHIR